MGWRQFSAGRELGGSDCEGATIAHVNLTPPEPAATIAHASPTPPEPTASLPPVVCLDEELQPTCLQNWSECLIRLKNYSLSTSKYPAHSKLHQSQG